MARVCIDCPAIIPSGQRRCAEHERARDRARGTTAARGYGTNHQRERARWQRRIDAGHEVTCWRCGEPIAGAWDLGHDDRDRDITRGPEHQRCNRATNTRRAE